MWFKLKYFRPRVTSKNCIPEEIKSGLLLGNACCPSIQNILTLRLVSKDLKIETHKTLYGCEAWSLKLGQERVWT